MSDGRPSAPPLRGHRLASPRLRRRPPSPARALPEAAATPHPRAYPLPARGTLARRLVVQVTSITTLVAIGLGLVTTVVAQRVLMGQLDDRLDGVLVRQQGTTDNPGKDYPGGVDLPGQPIGTVVVEISGDKVLNGVLTTEGIRGVPSNAALRTLKDLVPDGHARSVDLEMLGFYRVMSTEVDGHKVTVGIPLTETRTALVILMWTVGAIALLAIALSAGTVYLVVVRNLRPVTDLAAVAREVSATPLEQGRVDLAVRAPAPPPGQAEEVADVSEAFNQMLGHVEGALQARELSESKVRRFVADASHELRNPLAAIRGYAQLTRRDRASMPEQTARALDRIDSEAERMSALVEDLLLLARLDNNPVPASEPVDLTEVVVNAVTDAQAAGRDHVWTLDVPSDPVVTIGDPHQLHQVVVNLLANARTHTPRGTRVQAQVLVEQGQDGAGPQAVLNISDNGPGIPSSMIGQVFDRFVRADSARARIDRKSVV